MPSSLDFPLSTMYGFLLVLARVGSAFIFVPLPGITAGPEIARAALAVCFTVALFPVWPVLAGAAPSVGQMVAWMAGEAAFGLMVGLGVSFLIEGLLVAAQGLGVQAGYSYASTFDPNTQADSNVLVVFCQLTAGLLFFSLGFDRQVLKIFALSLQAWPPGAVHLNMDTAHTVARLGSTMFSTGMRLALPVIVLLMLVDVALALMGRMHSQLQLITLAFPVKMLATLAFLAVITVYFLPVFRSAGEKIFTTLFGVF